MLADGVETQSSQCSQTSTRSHDLPNQEYIFETDISILQLEISITRKRAFNQAIIEHENEGGIEGRFKRYSNNCKIICDGMKDLGFKQLLPNNLQAPIIITFMQPKSFDFNKFYNALSEKGFLIYPGKLTVAETFRIGCIGNLNEQDMHDTITAIKEVVNDSNFLVN